MQRVALAQFAMIHAQIRGDHIDLRFTGKVALWTAEAAQCAANGLVGVGPDAVVPQVRPPIRDNKEESSVMQRYLAHAYVGATIGDYLGVAPGEATFTVDSSLDVVDHRVTLTRGRKDLFAGQCEHDWQPSL